MGTDRNTGIGRDQLKDYTLKRQDLSPDGIVWQAPVIDKDLTTPPGSPSEDDRYLVISGAGAWTGYDNDIAHYHNGQWNYYTPIEGWFVWINDENKLYRFDGTSWTEFAGAGGISNIVEDTTPQLGGDLDLNGKNIDFPSVPNISDVKDEDDMVSDSATMLSTQQSIKAYVDGKAKITTGITIDGGGEVLETGYKGFIRIPYACTITKVSLLGDESSGSIVIDLWKCTYSEYDGGSTHPVDADSITASAPPTISSSNKSEDATLTGWTKIISSGDVIGFNVDSISTFTKVTLIIEITKT